MLGFLGVVDDDVVVALSDFSSAVADDGLSLANTLLVDPRPCTLMLLMGCFRARSSAKQYTCMR